MSKLLLGVIVAVLCGAFGSAKAAALGTGQITQMGGQGFGPNWVYFGISPAPVGKASCNTYGYYQFILDISTADGKALYSTLLAAKAAGLAVTVQGTGNCPSGVPVETVSYWILAPV